MGRLHQTTIVAFVLFACELSVLCELISVMTLKVTLWCGLSENNFVKSSANNLGAKEQSTLSCGFKKIVC